MSYQLPWDIHKPDVEPAPEPELPYTPPPANLPDRRQAEYDFAAVLRDAFAQALADAGPQLRDKAMDYAKGAIGPTLRGEDVHPTITATTATGRELVVADAKSRSWRTFVQGLAIDLFAALIAILSTLTHFDPFDKAAWTTVAALVIKTLVQTGMAYVMRLRVTPTIRTPGDKMALMPLPVDIPGNQEK